MQQHHHVDPHHGTYAGPSRELTQCEGSTLLSFYNTSSNSVAITYDVD